MGTELGLKARVGNSFTANSQVNGSQRYALKPCRARIPRPGMLPIYRSSSSVLPNIMMPSAITLVPRDAYCFCHLRQHHAYTHPLLNVMKPSSPLGIPRPGFKTTSMRGSETSAARQGCMNCGHSPVDREPVTVFGEHLCRLGYQRIYKFQIRSLVSSYFDVPFDDLDL